jgi:hypothetical protein
MMTSFFLTPVLFESFYAPVAPAVTAPPPPLHAAEECNRSQFYMFFTECFWWQMLYFPSLNQCDVYVWGMLKGTV